MPHKPPKPEGIPSAPRYKGAKTESPQSATIPSLRDLSRIGPTNDEFQRIVTEVFNIDDRATAISVSALVEHHLELAIIDKLTNTDTDTKDNLVAAGGALSGFFAKIYLGYAMGLYDSSIKEELNTIRKIRNAFAHAPSPVSFWTSQIVTECQSLPSRGATTTLASILASLPEGKARFIQSCFNAMLILLSTIRNT